MCIDQVNTKMNKFERFKDHKGHLERLAQIRTGLDTKSPKLPSFLARRAINPGVRMDRAMKIEYENRVIYSRMCGIQNKNSPYSACLNVPSKCPAYELISYHRLKKNEDISYWNSKLHKKFLFTKPTYSHTKMNDEYNYIKYLEKNISENVNRFNPNLDFITFKQFDKNLQKERKRRRPQSASYKGRGGKRRININRTYDIKINTNDMNDINNINNNDLFSNTNYNNYNKLLMTDYNNMKESSQFAYTNNESNKCNILDQSTEEKYKSCYTHPNEIYYKNEGKENSGINNKRFKNRPNSCKPNIEISREIQEPSEYISKSKYNNTNINNTTNYTSANKTKPTSGKTRTNGSNSSNGVVFTNP